MSLISAFVDAFKKAFGSGKPKVDIEEVRSTGGLGSTVDTGAFDPIKRTSQPVSGDPVDVGDLEVASSDPEEGGESPVR